jgi:hypothetical protein
MIVTHYIIDTIVDKSSLNISNIVNEYYNYKHSK